VAVDVEHVGLMLVCAGRDQEIRHRHAMLALCCELALGRARDGDRLDVDAKLVEVVERSLESLELAR
jgi:hypothetical protein